MTLCQQNRKEKAFTELHWYLLRFLVTQRKLRNQMNKNFSKIFGSNVLKTNLSGSMGNLQMSGYSFLVFKLLSNIFDHYIA